MKADNWIHRFSGNTECKKSIYGVKNSASVLCASHCRTINNENNEAQSQLFHLTHDSFFISNGIILFFMVVSLFLDTHSENKRERTEIQASERQQSGMCANIK